MHRTRVLRSLSLSSVFTVFSLVASLGIMRPAGAQEQPSASDLARSEGLFKEATVLLEQGHVAEACPKFVESQRLAPGIGVTLYLADCFERVGKTASAWREFRRAEEIAAAKKDARATIARTRANALEEKLSNLTIEVPAAARVSGLKVANDGIDVPEANWGKASPADAGPHVVTASAPGYRRREFNVVVPPNKGAAKVTLEALDTGEATAPAAVTAPAPEPAKAPASTPEPKDDVQDGRTQRWIGLGVGAAGVIVTGVGLVFGLSAQSKLDESNQPGNCNNSDFCTRQGLALRDDAGSAATLSTVFVGVGLAALAGGAILYFTAPRGAKAMPTARGFLLRF